MTENMHKFEKAVPCCSAVERRDLIALSAERRNLISTANKVFGEGKWSHTVVKQTLDIEDLNLPALINGINVEHKYYARCVSYVKVQLENGDCYEDDGSYIAEESRGGLSAQKARIGSVENALKKVFLSFGDRIERELQRQISFEQELMDLVADFPDLISAANQVFGEGKWNHTVVSQTLDFEDAIYNDIDARYKYVAGCVSYVKVQLENGNFHEDIGYYNAEEPTRGLAIQNTRIGSAVNALKRVLLSFGDKVERELQQLRRQISFKQVNTFATAEPMDLAADFSDLISAANKVFGEGKWNHTVVSQNLDFDDLKAFRNAPWEYYTGCVSFVKVQLENGNFHKDVGYFNAVESTRFLSIQNARIGSAVNALKRVFLSFGDEVEKEMQQLRGQISSEQVNTFATAEPVDLATDFSDAPELEETIPSAMELLERRHDLISAERRNLISAANKVFGERKWNHTVVSQTLDFDDICNPGEYRYGCVSFVKIQLENGNFHEDVGYFNAEESTRNLSIYNARIGSAVNALRRVLLSFGEKIEKELQRQVIPEQVSDIKKNRTQSLLNAFATTKPMDLIAEFPDLISAANKVFEEGNWSHTVVKQTLDFNDSHPRYSCCDDSHCNNSYCEGSDFDDEDFDDEDFDIFHDESFNESINDRSKYHAGCASYVKVQVENGNFHEDVGYCSTMEPTKGLSILNAKIGSTVNALKRVLLSFGEKVERELQRQIRLEQTNDVQRDAQLLDKQISEKSNVSDPTLVSIVNNRTTAETNPSSSVTVQSAKIVEPSPNKTNFTSE